MELNEDNIWERTVSNPPNFMVVVLNSFTREITIGRLSYAVAEDVAVSRGGREGG